MNVYSDLKKVGTFLKGRCSLHAGKMKDHKCNVAGRLGERARSPGRRRPALTLRPHTTEGAGLSRSPLMTSPPAKGPNPPTPSPWGAGFQRKNGGM